MEEREGGSKAQKLLLSVADVAHHLGVCRQTVYNYSWFGHFQVGFEKSAQSWSYSFGDKSKSAKRCCCNSDRGVTWR